MNAITILTQSFDFGTALTKDQLISVVKRFPQIASHIEHLDTEGVDKLDDSEIYGPAPRDEDFNDLNVRGKMEKSYDYGMVVGYNQAMYGYCAFRKLPIDGLEHDMPVALFILGVKYDAGVNTTDGKHELVLTTPLEPTEYIRIDLDSW